MVHHIQGHRQPVYLQIAESLRADLKKQPHAGKIPGEHELSRKYQANFKTVNKAVSLLIREGLLYRLKGKGTFAADLSETARQQSALVGLVLPSLVNPYFAKLAQAFETVASKKSTSVLVNTVARREDWSRILALYGKRHPQAFIINDSVLAQQKISAREIQSIGIPVIQFGDTSASSDGDTLWFDMQLGAEKAVTHLIQNFGSRIAHVSGSSGPLEHDSRYLGYRKALAQHGIPYDPKLVRKVVNSYRGGYEAVKQLFRLVSPPKGILVYNDFMALGAENAVLELGLKIPQDLGIVGFDDSIPVQEMVLPTSTVLFPYEKSAQQVLELARRRILFPQIEPKKIRVGPTLILRKSSLPERKFKSQSKENQ